MIHQIAIVCSLLFMSACELDIQPLPDTIVTEVNKAIERRFDGIIVYVNQADNSSFYSAGWKNRENQVPADPHALFKIGSISKLYIAAATSKLIADQHLSLDSTLAKLIPEVAGRIEYADKITLRMMLQHRSGIPDFLYDPGFENSNPEENYLTTAALIFDKPADFQPDKKNRYSNTNYLMN